MGQVKQKKVYEYLVKLEYIMLHDTPRLFKDGRYFKCISIWDVTQIKTIFDKFKL